MSEPRFPRQGWRRWLALPSRNRAQVSNDVDDELTFHLAMREEELRRRGLSPAAAASEARSRFGDVAQTRSALRASDNRMERKRRVQRWWNDATLDVAYAARRMAREPGFAAVVVATLALGIGATVAIASILQRLVLAPLPYEGAERLVTIRLQSKDNSIRVSPSAEIVERWQAGIPSLERLETLASLRMATRREDRTVLLDAGRVSPGLLEFLGVSPALGRAFLPRDTLVAGDRVAMISWNAWKRTWVSDPSIIGSSITLDGVAYTIVGVMPGTFDPSVFGLLPRVDIWLPHVAAAGGNFNGAIGVRRRGSTIEQMERELDAARLQLPEGQRFGSLVTSVVPLLDTAGQQTSATLIVVAAAIGLVLLIGCINVANLLLARGAAREREMTIRGAIGAGRSRLIRQLLMESLLLSAVGATAGLLLARGLLAVAQRIRPPTFASLDDAQLDGQALLVALGAAMLTALIFGLVPAVVVSRPSGGDGTGRSRGVLQGGTRSVGHGVGGRRLRRALVFAEVACSVALVIGAVLLVRSATSLNRMRLGYDVDPLLTMRLMSASGAKADSVSWSTALPTILQGVRAYPGVQGVTVADGHPGIFGGCLCELLPEGRPIDPASAPGFMVSVRVDSTYVRTTGTRMLIGRGPSSDTTLREAAITAQAARRMWGTEHPIGRRFRLSRDDQPLTVVGLMEPQLSPEGWLPGDSVQIMLGGPPHGDEPLLTVRVAGSPTAAARELAALVERIAPRVHVVEAHAFRELVHEGRAAQRFTRHLLVSFAAVALLLASLGLYGVMAYGVTQRTREIGVRMALGARRGDIGRLIAGEGLWVTALGVLAGSAGSALLTRRLEGFLVGVSRWDPLTYVAAVVVVAGAAGLALWVPVRRAGRVTPTQAIAAE